MEVLNNSPRRRGGMLQGLRLCRLPDKLWKAVPAMRKAWTAAPQRQVPPPVCDLITALPYRRIPAACCYNTGHPCDACEGLLGNTLATQL